MSDHVSATLIVHALPRQHARLVMDLIEEHGLTDGLDAAEDGVLLGVAYTAHDRASGALDSIEAVMSKIPQAAWTAWYDPDSNGLGELRRFVPGLGMFRAACDEDGNAVFYSSKIQAALKTEQIPQALYDLIGQKWIDAIESMNACLKLHVTPPPVYSLEWDRKTGDIDIAGRGGYTVGYDGPTAAPATAPVSPGAAEEQIEKFLAARGWIVVDEWASAFRGRLWSTQVYRADDCEVSA